MEGQATEQPSTREGPSPALITLAVLVLLAAVVIANFYAGVLVLFGCEGTDASEPPDAGTTAAAACGSAMSGLHLFLAMISVLAPIACAPAALRVRSWRPVLYSAVLSAAALAPLTIRTDLVQESEEIVFPTLVFPTLVVLAVALVLLLKTKSGR